MIQGILWFGGILLEIDMKWKGISLGKLILAIAVFGGTIGWEIEP